MITCLAWGLTFLLMLMGLQVGVRQKLVREVDFLEIFTFRDPWGAFWIAYVVVLYLAGVLYPWLFMIPWRIASRFQKVWNALQLRELHLTELHPWEMFLGVILGPLWRWILFCLATFLLCVGVALLWHLQTPTQSQWELRLRIGYVNLLTSPILFGLLLNLHVIGFARRTRFRGLAAFGAAWILLAVLLLGLIAGMIVVATTTGGAYVYALAFAFAYVAAMYVWAGRRAFYGVTREVERIVGE